MDPCPSRPCAPSPQLQHRRTHGHIQSHIHTNTHARTHSLARSVYHSIALKPLTLVLPHSHVHSPLGASVGGSVGGWHTIRIHGEGSGFTRRNRVATCIQDPPPYARACAPGHRQPDHVRLCTQAGSHCTLEHALTSAAAEAREASTHLCDAHMLQHAYNLRRAHTALASIGRRVPQRIM